MEGAEHSQVGPDVLLADHHSGGSSGGTRGVLKEGDVLGRWALPAIWFRLEFCQNRGVESEGGSTVVGDSLQTTEGSVAAVFLHRRRGYRKHSRADTSPERSDEVETGFESQQNSFARLYASFLQGASQSLCRSEEPGVAQLIYNFVIADESESSVGILLGGIF